MQLACVFLFVDVESSMLVVTRQRLPPGVSSRRASRPQQRDPPRLSGAPETRAAKRIGKAQSLGSRRPPPADRGRRG